MRRLTYKNPKGDEISFYLSPFLIESLTGIGEVETDSQSQKTPYTDGVTYVDSKLSPRYMDMDGSIIERDFQRIRELRREIVRVCNPKLGLGKITFELDGETYKIDGIPNAVPKFPERGNAPMQSFSIEWFCPNPYWLSMNQESKPLQAYVGNFKLPMTFPFELGMSGSRSVLYNDGDDATPVQIEINGPTTNPRIINRTTGEFIRINRTISDSEVMYLDTTSGQKSIVIKSGNEETQAFGFLDPASTLFGLAMGENEVEHVADAGNRHAQVVIRWQNRFVGI